MSDAQAGQVDTLGDRLATRAQGYGLLPALSLLEYFATLNGSPRLGDERTPQDAAVQLVSRPTLAFPASEVDSIELDPDGRGRLTTRVAGLLGHGGPLPDWITEEITQRIRRGDRAAVAFLHIFEQRLLTIGYRAAAQTRLGAALRPPDASVGGLILHALLGLGTPGMTGRLGIPDRALMGYAGLLTGHARSRGALERMLRDYLGVPVAVIPFTGRWLRLEADDVTRLGTPGASNRLGQDAILGGRVWDRQSCFTLRVGPLEPAEYETLLPGGSQHRSLRVLTRFFVGPGLDFQLTLQLRPHRIRPPVIRTRGPGARLGLTTFLVGRPDTRATGVVSLSMRDIPATFLAETPP